MLARLFAGGAGLAAAIPAAAAEAGAPTSPVSIGTLIGMAVFVLLAVLIGLSVVAKLLIVTRVVPRQPETPSILSFMPSPTSSAGCG